MEFYVNYFALLVVNLFYQSIKWISYKLLYFIKIDAVCVQELIIYNYI